MDNRPGSGEARGGLVPGRDKLKLPNQDIAAKYQAARSSPRSFEAVFDYGRTVALFCLASLLDTRCASCAGDLPTYRPRSELDTAYWPVIEDVLPMLDPFLENPKLDAEQMELLVEVKGRLLWLAGRSSEEQTLIDSYAQAHPTAVTVVKRRLEILREAGDPVLLEAQCTRSRARMKASPEAARLDLLTSCVALHPKNDQARSDVPDYATFLPNLSPDEAALYRGHLVDKCVEKAGDEESRCGPACACLDKDSGKPATSKCKRACGDCRSGLAQEVRACQKLGEVPPDPAQASRPKRTRSTRR